MAISVGRYSRVAVSDDGGSTYTDIGELLGGGSFSISTDIADATTNDSNGWKEGEYASSQGTLDVTFKFDYANAGQLILHTEMVTTKGKLYVRVRPIEGSGNVQYIFIATLDSFGIDSAEGDVMEGSATFTSSGSITASTQ